MYVPLVGYFRGIADATYGRIRLQSNELEKELEIRRDRMGRELQNNLSAIEPFWMEKRPSS